MCLVIMVLLACQDVCKHMVSQGLLCQPLVCVPQICLFHPHYGKILDVCMMIASQPPQDLLLASYRSDVETLQYMSEAFMWNAFLLPGSRLYAL